MIQIGVDYQRKIEELRDSIRESSVISLEGIAEDHARYFCMKKIEGSMKV